MGNQKDYLVPGGRSRAAYIGGSVNDANLDAIVI